MVVTQNEVNIATVQGFYGHDESSTILTILRQQLIKADYIQHWWGNHRCRLTYFDETGRTQSLKFVVVNPDVSVNYQLTEVIAGLLEDLRFGNAIQTVPFQFTLTVNRPVTKLLYGALLLGGLWLVDFQTGSTFWLFVSSFFIWISSAAISIDHIRLHAAWPPIVKVVAAILIFGLAFVL